MVYKRHPSVIMASLTLAFYMLVPFFILVCCTVAMLFAYVRAREITKHAVVAGGSFRKRRSDNGKLVTLTAMIVVGYSVTCIPCVVSNYYFLSLGLLPYQYRNEPFATTALAILYLNSLVDFVVYSALDERFRSYVLRVLLRRPPQSKDLRLSAR